MQSPLDQLNLPVIRDRLACSLQDYLLIYCVVSMFRALALCVSGFLATVLMILALTIGLLLPERWCFNPMMRVWAWVLVAGSGIRLAVSGRENLAAHPNCCLIGNHQSALDIPILICVTGGHLRIAAKKSLFYIPLVGWCMWVYGFMPIERSNVRKTKKAIDAMIRRLASHSNSLAIFPEGSRSKDSSIAQFKPGAMNICQRSTLPIVPFALEGSGRVLKRNTLRVNPGLVQLSFAPAIPSSEAQDLSSASLAQRVRSEVVRMHEDLQRQVNLHSTAVSIVAGEGQA